jgi:hypothetical protein
MKALKTILIIIGAILALVLILSLIGAKTFRVERSTMVKAPAEMVYPYVSNLKSMEAWGPWKEMEHNMTTTYEGEDGKVGSKSTWKSDESKGSQGDRRDGTQQKRAHSAALHGTDGGHAQPVPSTCRPWATAPRSPGAWRARTTGWEG